MLKNFMKNWEIIRDEGLKCIQEAPILDKTRKQSLDSIDLINEYGWVKSWTNDLNWLNYGIYYNNTLMSENSNKCPILTKLANKLNKKYTIFMLGFSLLKPGGIIPEHVDDKSQYLVYHLGLSVSNPFKCLLIVDKLIHFEIEGKLIQFNDTLPHAAINDTEEDRLILYIKCKKNI